MVHMSTYVSIHEGYKLENNVSQKTLNKINRNKLYVNWHLDVTYIPTDYVTSFLRRQYCSSLAIPTVNEDFYYFTRKKYRHQNHFSVQIVKIRPTSNIT